MIKLLLNIIFGFDGILLFYLLCKCKRKIYDLESDNKMLRSNDKTLQYELQDNIKENLSIKKENNLLNEKIIILNNEIYDKNMEIARLTKNNNDNKDNNDLDQEKKITINDLPFIEEDFGRGLIRYNEGDVYYHGIGKHEKQKWNENNKWDKSMLLISTDKKITKSYITHNIDEYCNNCMLDELLCKQKGPIKKSSFQVYKCLGHQY